jgi:hypothetical protein
LSEEYAKRIQKRLKSAKAGDPLDGAADPLASAPATVDGKTLHKKNGRSTPGKRKRSSPARRKPVAGANGTDE